MHSTPSGPKEGSPERTELREEPTGLDAEPLEPRRCELYFAGHTVHWIQALRSAAQPHVTGTLLAVEDHVITVDLAGEEHQWRNHDPERLLESIGVGGEVRVCADWFILTYRPPGSMAFTYDSLSIYPIHKPWTPCAYTPFEATSFEDLAERARTHGGFSIPGRVVTDWSEDEGDQ